MKPSDQDIATHEACGHYPYRDWCRACVGATGRSDAHKRRREEQNRLLVASMNYGFFDDGDDGEHTKGATPFLVVKVKPSMVSDNEPAMLAFCDAVIRELRERFGI